MSRPVVIAFLLVAACSSRPPARAPAPHLAVERSTALRVAGDWTAATVEVEHALDDASLDDDAKVRLIVERASIERERASYQDPKLLDGARTLLDRAEPLLANVRPPTRAAYAEERGWIIYFAAFDTGRFDDAMPHYQEARKLRETLDDRAALARSWFEIGLVHQQAGRIAEARDAFERGHPLTVSAPIERAYLERHLGAVVADETGDPAQAIPYYERSLALREGAGNHWGIAFASITLADAVAAAGDTARACTLLARATTVAAELELHVATESAAELRTKLACAPD